MAEEPLTESHNRRTNATVFLGGGRITSALLAGLHLAGYRKPIVVHDRHPEKLRALKREFRIETAPDLSRALRHADMLIVAVRPESVVGLLSDIFPLWGKAEHPPLLAISLAAGIPLRKLRTHFGPPVRWARAMPSPVCRIARGLTAITFDRAANKSDRKRAWEFFQNVGSVLEITEDRFDAFTVTYSSSHGYHALDALAQAAQSFGLDRKTALIAASHALADGILYWRESGQGLEHLLHEAATPGGIAATTMQAMNKAGYLRAVSKGLRAGIERAKRNAKY